VLVQLLSLEQYNEQQPKTESTNPRIAAILRRRRRPIFFVWQHLFELTHDNTVFCWLEQLCSITTKCSEEILWLIFAHLLVLFFQRSPRSQGGDRTHLTVRACITQTYEELIKNMTQEEQEEQLKYQLLTNIANEMEDEAKVLSWEQIMKYTNYSDHAIWPAPCAYDKHTLAGHKIHTTEQQRRDYFWKNGAVLDNALPKSSIFYRLEDLLHQYILDQLKRTD
jgi:hypothetical protein